MTRFALRHECVPHEAFLAGIQRAWQRLGFAPGPCARLLQRASVDAGFADYFEIDAIARGEHFVNDRMLFEGHDYDSWYFRSELDGRALEREIGPEGAAFFGQLLFSWSRRHPDLEESWRAFAGDEPLPAAPRGGAHGYWPRHGPGITRREHASVLLDSGSARIVTDPQALQSSWTTDEGRYPDDVDGLSVDAVFVSHSHTDHFSLPSIIGCCREGTKTVVPHVERSNLLSFDQRRVCEIVGLDVDDPSWGSIVSVGDIDVEVLPFYGEQPTYRDVTTPAGVRNWGNCLRFQVAGMSAVLLVDSGEDPHGVVYEALRRSVARFGPVDVLLACCATFPEVLNQGLPSYMFTQPFETIVRTHRERVGGGRSPSITFGPRGVAEACRAAGARWFLPYAHGFAGLGSVPRSEHGDLLAVERALRELDVPTRVVDWRPGDHCSITADGELEVRRCCAEGRAGVDRFTHVRP